MALMRVRAASFLAGFGIATGLALYQIRQDVVNSNAEVKAEVRTLVRSWNTIATPARGGDRRNKDDWVDHVTTMAYILE